MLFQLGALTIDSPAGLNATSHSQSRGADFALKPVVGARQPREFTGPADAQRMITGKLFPFFYTRAGVKNGVNEMAMLGIMAESGEPYLLVNGAGQNLGFWYVLRFERGDEQLSANGTGREIAYSIYLALSADKPSQQSMIQSLETLFG